MDRQHIDVALLDVDMPLVDGIAAAKIIADISPATTVVMYTAFRDESFLAEALAAGANGFLTKDIPAPDLARLLQQAHAGSTVMSPEPMRILQESYLDRTRRREEYAEFIAAAKALPDHLTKVLTHLVHAASNRKIARSLGLSESTVRTYVTQLYDRLQCSSRAEVVMKTMRSGLIDDLDFEAGR